MGQHYTRSTVSASGWCPRCRKNTQHRVDGRRLGPCLDCIDRPLPPVLPMRGALVEPGLFDKLDGAYAKKIGLSRKAVTRLGGAAKLCDLPVESVKILTNSHAYGNSHDIHKGGLKARGIPLGKWPLVPTQFGNEARIEAEIQRRLRERGLDGC